MPTENPRKWVCRGRRHPHKNMRSLYEDSRGGAGGERERPWVSVLISKGLCSWFINLRPECLMNYPCDLQQSPSLWLKLIRVSFCPLNSQGFYQDPFVLQSQIIRELAKREARSPYSFTRRTRLLKSQGEIPPFSHTTWQPAVKGAAFSLKHMLQKGICRTP